VIQAASANAIDGTNWIMYRETPTNSDFLITEGTASISGFNNNRFGMTRSGNVGRFYAYSGFSGWRLIDNVTFSPSIGSFSEDDSDEHFESHSILWMANILGRNPFSFNEPQPLTSLSGDLSDFYNWLTTVTFSRNDGSPLAPMRIPINYNPAGVPTVGALPSTNPTRAGFDFIGWFTAHTGGTRVTAGMPITATTGRSFYARWIPTVNVTFPANNSAVAMGRDLRITWEPNPNVYHYQIALYNRTLGTAPIDNPLELFAGTEYTIASHLLIPGHNYTIELFGVYKNNITIAGRQTINFTVVEFDVRWVVPSHHTAGSAFGMRMHPIRGVLELHGGIDVGIPTGTPIVAAMDGRVEISTESPTAGHFIDILHDNGFRTRYLHLNVRLVEREQYVNAGQHIGNSGNTGTSTSPHLHFDLVNPSGRHINPLARYHADSSRTTNANPFYLEGSTIVYNPNFCEDCARGYNYAGAVFTCIGCR
jgi:uncharacterized repeat protein (TIGR02543 family)